jgi:hypothetical protein
MSGTRPDFGDHRFHVALISDYPGRRSDESKNQSSCFSPLKTLIRPYPKYSATIRVESFATNKNKFPGTFALARLEMRPYRDIPGLIPGPRLHHRSDMIIARSRLISLVLFTAILLAVLVSSWEPGSVSVIA